MFSPDLEHIFRSNVGNEFVVITRGNGPHKTENAYEINRILSLMIHTHLIEYKIVGAAKALLLPCFPFISQLKAGDVITTGQYMNYQTLSNLQFRSLLKKSFRSFHNDLKETSDEKIPFVSVGITASVLSFKKASMIQKKHERRSKMVASRQVEVPTYKGIGRQQGRGLGALARVIGKTFWVKISSQLQDA